jgi:hypothetical protein
MRTSSETNCCAPVLAAILRLVLALQSPVVTLCMSCFNIKKFYVLTIYEMCEDFRISRDHFHIKVKGKGKVHPRTGHEGPEGE